MATPDPSRTLLIIPAFNEEAALPAVLAELARVAPGHDVVVVDDGSLDATSRVAAGAGVSVVRLPFNLGIGGALRTGFRYAVQHGYSRAIQFDADGQHDPSQLERLEASLDDGADLVIGSRFAGEGDYQPGVARGLAMKILVRIIRFQTGRSFSDTSSGFRGFSERMLSAFAEHYPSEYMESVEALSIAHRAGFDVREVAVVMRERQEGVASNRSLKLAFHYVRLLLVVGLGPRLPGPADIVPGVVR